MRRTILLVSASILVLCVVHSLPASSRRCRVERVFA